MVVQDPVASFVTDTVEEEIAYGMEAMGVEATAMRRRVEETLDLLGLAELRGRALRDLSGGQQQRVAIGRCSPPAPGPRAGRADVGARPRGGGGRPGRAAPAGARPRHHRRAGRAPARAGRPPRRPGGAVGDGRTSALLEPAEAMRTSPVLPPVVGLGRAAGWTPLPLSVRDARRRAVGAADDARRAASCRPPTPVARAGDVSARVHRLVVRRGPVTALRGVDLDLARGERDAVMGRNGAGKSTLLAALAGSLRPSSGACEVSGRDPAATCRRRSWSGSSGWCPRSPPSAVRRVGGRRVRDADADFAVAPGTTRGLLDRVARAGRGPPAPPRPVRGAAAVARAGRRPGRRTRGCCCWTSRPAAWTTGPRSGSCAILRELAASGSTVVLATHDVELAAEVAERVVVLADGEVVADGPVHEVLAGSPAFAPQVAKIVHPLPFLTVAEVTAALEPAS